MIVYFNKDDIFYAVGTDNNLVEADISKLLWLFRNSVYLKKNVIEGTFIGPRKEMITPWSTNAVEITQNMGISGIKRIEQFRKVTGKLSYDKMLNALYNNLDESIFEIDKQAEEILYINDIKKYNFQQGLALSEDEILYLEEFSKKSGRPLTDSEVFGFSQVNSEHCRHKIFNGIFIIDGVEKEFTLFELIKLTTKKNKKYVISAYKDNCAFISGSLIKQFAPEKQDSPDFFVVKDIDSVISIKAETHNFPTTVEPFNGAATGSGGEIRDRIAGGKGGVLLAGTAVYITSYPRLDNERNWEKKTKARQWLYQTPEEILIKASNGASDYGNKFGQPLICGSLLTFEHFTASKKYGYDKVIMLAGGIGFAKKEDSLKDIPVKDENIVVLGGDNYRIGMGGGAVSSVATGEYNNTIELNAVQRSNPEMQKRVYNVIRALAESDSNPIVSIHDHGAGGHLNCLSELVEETGGTIYLDKLPIGDKTLSAKEIIGNESQERMGLIIKSADTENLIKISERERAPVYIAGTTTGDNKLTFKDSKQDIKPVDIDLEYLFGKPPKTVINDVTVNESYEDLKYDINHLPDYLKDVLQIEAVACKDWLTNKVDRSVTGKVARQQCVGKIQLPLSDLGVTALDYIGKKGVATSLGSAPIAALIDPAAGSVLSIAEALTNIVWAPLEHGLSGVSLSANWMWSCKNKGEDARLYKAVEAASAFSIALGINIPTGKDSLSMTQKYKDGDVVYAPGTVIISAAGEVSDINRIVYPVIVEDINSYLIYIDFSGVNFRLGGSSFAQVINQIGNQAPDVASADYFINVFESLQDLIKSDKILAAHDISAGGLIIALLEMNFANEIFGLDIDLSTIPETDLIKLLFSENPGVIVQVKDLKEISNYLEAKNIKHYTIGKPIEERILKLKHQDSKYIFDIDEQRDYWYKTSYLLDKKQTEELHSLERFNNYKNQPLKYKFKDDFRGTINQYGIEFEHTKRTGIKACIIREKGVNGDREMAYAMYLAGFDVKDVHITDLVSGRETLEDINFIVFVGGFSNSDVLGSAKGWAGAFLYNEKAKQALDNFYKRNDTLSLGICNGCQLMVELGVIFPQHEIKPKMLHNGSAKFESAFLTVDVCENESVMLKSLSGSRLGVWVAHGEGRFSFPYEENKYNIPAKFTYNAYPGNPNDSDFAAAGICSADGRHLAMMPHIERAFLPWQWAYYPEDRKNDVVAPWIEAFVNARKWIKTNLVI